MNVITKLEKDITELTDIVTTHIEEGISRDTEIFLKIEVLTNKISELNTSITGLVSVWEQAQGILTFVKWLCGISGSVIAVIAFFKGVRG